ncbi:MAG: acyl carrier protein [Bacteroidales bacterium]|nr:acyl carrier protein [Bacteroidales bacterium]
MEQNPNLEERLKDVMSAVFEVEPSEINEESSQDNISGWDSVKSLALIVSLEEEFGVSIPLEEVVNMTNFKYIKLTIEELLK